MATTQTWQLSMGVSQYPAIVDFLQHYDLPHPLVYPKGKAVMKDVPQVGDKVIITCKGKEIAAGTILESFHDTLGGEAATVNVEKIIYSQPQRQGRRRNWTKIES